MALEDSIKEEKCLTEDFEIVECLTEEAHLDLDGYIKTAALHGADSEEAEELYGRIMDDYGSDIQPYLDAVNLLVPEGYLIYRFEIIIITSRV